MNLSGILILFSIIVGILLAKLFQRKTRTDNSKKCRYDERQEVVRGKGFKYGFFTILICNGLSVCLKIAEVPLFAELELPIIIGSFTGIGIWAVYCIWNEGYFALNENKGKIMILFITAAIMNFTAGIASIVHGTIIQDGKLTYQSINFFGGLLFIIIFLTMFLKKAYKDGRDEQE